MTIDHASIAEKKAKLQQAIRVLGKLKGRSIESIREDEITLGAVQHYLILGIEIILDIGSHVLTEDFKVSPQSYEDTLILLGKKNVIPKRLTDQVSGMGQFRNKLIHEYSDVDVDKVYAYLQKAPEQFEQFEQFDQAFSEYFN